jgi:hypothetical protein
MVGASVSRQGTVRCVKRFALGNSGRPKGARSRLITELEQAMELAAPQIVRILIGRAQCGDGSMEATKYVLERIAPSRRGRLVEIEGFPAIGTPADVPAALASLATAVGDGIITIEEATAAGTCSPNVLGHLRDRAAVLQRFTTWQGRQPLTGFAGTIWPQLPSGPVLHPFN